MPLTLVLGPANSAKAGEVLGVYAAAARRGGLLVVPTRLDARHYARELAADGSVFGSVLTFAGLASEIARRAGYASRRLSALQRERVLRRVVAGAQLGALAQSASAPGFALATGELIVELERSLITPQRFTRALHSWSAEDERRRPYAEDLAVLYHDYVRELERLARVDAELYTWRALDALRAAPGQWGTDPVFFYGFDDLTALERDAVETLSRIARADVTVSLTYEPGRAALMARAEAVAELRPLAERLIELPALDEHYAAPSRMALHHLERMLFEPAPERREPGRAVRLLEAGGERAEAELVAAEVLDLLRAGIPGDEIAVVYRSLARSAPVASRVFDQYGIPLTSGYEVPFRDTALGRGVRGLARCALLGEHEARPEDLLDYLRCPGVLDRPEIADGLESRVRREGLWTASQARAHLGWTLGEIDSLRRAPDPATELGRHARRLFAAPHRGGASPLAGPEELDARALATLLRALREVGELGQGVSGLELIELLHGLAIPAGITSPGAVLLAEPLEIRARRFRAVFVCGLQEGEFPLPGHPEPFLSDERRRELAACSGLRLRPREDALERERYLFYACVSRATEQVVLSYRSSDEEGNLSLPSPFIADVAELLTDSWPTRRRRRLLADVVWAVDNAPTERELVRARAAAHAPAAGSASVAPRVLSEDALRYVRHRQILSAGALESYADCPVRWLVERELQPARFEPEPEAIARGNRMHDTLELVLRRLGGAVTEASLSEAKRILDEVLSEIPADRAPAGGLAAGGLAADGLPAGGAPAGVGVPPGARVAVRAAALRAIEADLHRYLEDEARDGCESAPAGLELRFGFDDGEPSLAALELADGPDRVLVRGMIDRVDVDAGGRAIVRDYKSGVTRAEYQGARWKLDRRLQVALYMLVVRELLGRESIAGLYQPLRGDDVRPRGVYLADAPVGARVLSTDARDQAGLDAELEAAAARAVALAKRLRAGELTPCPETCSREGCAYPGICRSQ